MYQTKENTIRINLNNQTLVSCTRMVEHIKKPPCIPHYEAYTYALVARYFELTEKRVHNAYLSHRYVFENDCAMVSGNQMLHHVRDVKSLGVSYGHLCEFTNGVVAQISYSSNLIFNNRALLNFAIIFKDESDTAKKIYDILCKDCFNNKGYLKHKAPWFSEFKDESIHVMSISEPSPSVICPYIATMSAGNKPRDKKPMKMQRKAHHTGRINQLDDKGKVIHVWDSMTDAANTLGINIASISGCCSGRQKTTGASRRGADGKYRFSYADK